jgi:hypothetical protein
MRARAEAKGYKNGTKYNSLMSQILYGKMLPTPKATEISETWEQHKNRAKNPNAKNRGASLSATISGMLPTPVASDHQNRWPTENWRGNDLPSVINGKLGTRSQLNPHFVEEMMGFPKGWTVLPFQSGEENQSKDTETQ